MNLSKDFENLELTLQNIREESEEIFDAGKELFDERFWGLLEWVFQRDILGAKKAISTLWQIDYVDSMRGWEWCDERMIFEKNVKKVLQYLPLWSENREDLWVAILWLSEVDSWLLENYFSETSFRRDTLYPIIEWLFIEWEISREEYALIESSYNDHGNIHEALWKLPHGVRNMILEDVSAYTSWSESEKEQNFHDEYHRELAELHGAWYDVFPIKRFVARSYFKNPGKLRKCEHPGRRLRRTFKMALLRILKMKFGSVDAEKLLRQFDQCETFQEMFILLYKLFEVLGENDENKESFQILEETELIEKLVIRAEDTKEKILEWEKITADISSLIWETDAELDEWILEKILEDDTHFHWDEILFAHGDDDMAGAYSEASSVWDEEEDERDVIDSWDTLEWNYENLKEYFHEIDEDKRKAFLEWKFEHVDDINAKLVSIQSKIEKVAKLIGKEL